MNRIPRELYYLEIAKAAAMRSTCINKHWGAVIVKDDAIISTGYNGSPRGVPNCCDTGYCYRIENNIQRGTQYERCMAIHAEANAIINASHGQMINATLYLYGYDVLGNCIVDNPDSCIMCKRMIINSGITEVVFADKNGIMKHKHPNLEFGYRIVQVCNWVDSFNLAETGY